MAKKSTTHKDDARTSEKPVFIPARPAARSPRILGFSLLLLFSWLMVLGFIALTRR